MPLWIQNDERKWAIRHKFLNTQLINRHSWFVFSKESTNLLCCALKKFLKAIIKLSRTSCIKSSIIQKFIFYFLKSSPKDMFLLIWEEGVERKKHQCERETSVGCLLYMPWPKDWTCNLSMCLDQEWNPQPFGVQNHTPTNYLATQERK